MKKRILAGFLMLVMLLSLLPATALATETESQKAAFNSTGYTASKFTTSVSGVSKNGMTKACAHWKDAEGSYYLAIAAGKPNQPQQTEEYRLILDANGGQWGTAVDEGYMPDDTTNTVIAKENIPGTEKWTDLQHKPTREGYMFAGWGVMSVATTGKVVALPMLALHPGMAALHSVAGVPDVEEKAVKLYAMWEKTGEGQSSGIGYYTINQHFLEKNGETAKEIDATSVVDGWTAAGTPIDELIGERAKDTECRGEVYQYVATESKLNGNTLTANAALEADALSVIDLYYYRDAKLDQRAVTYHGNGGILNTYDKKIGVDYRRVQAAGDRGAHPVSARLSRRHLRPRPQHDPCRGLPDVLRPAAEQDCADDCILYGCCRRTVVHRCSPHHGEHRRCPRVS